METGRVSRATAAATSIAAELGLLVEQVVVIQDSNKLALRLLPCDVFARVACVGHEVAALEVAIAQRLGALACPVATLDPRVEARVHELDGFAVTFWTYYEDVAPDPQPPADYAQALQDLHAGMRSFQFAAPHFMERVTAAEGLVTNRDKTPGLTAGDRELLLTTLRGASQRIRSDEAVEQLLHGEPHPANLLRTENGLVFVDFETCCRGPVEFDVAHVPDEVSRLYPGVDELLLQECRRLVLAMVAAWRWDIQDEFPNGAQHGRDILGLLRTGPPWPVLGVLSAR